MCGVIVVDAGMIGLLVSDVMPIYMIIPRYSHNYAQFYQLLNSNLFTHRKILMLSREASRENYGPDLSFIILSPSDLTFASFREGFDNPFIAFVARFLFVCVGA